MGGFYCHIVRAICTEVQPSCIIVPDEKDCGMKYYESDGGYERIPSSN